MREDAPWFRRYFGFSFIPVSPQGRAATVAFLLVEAALGFLSIQVAEDSLVWWLLAALMSGIFLGFWAFVLSKTPSH